MVSTHGQIKENTKDGGKMAFNMGMANNSVLKNRNGFQENGKKEKGSKLFQRRNKAAKSLQ